MVNTNGHWADRSRPVAVDLAPDMDPLRLRIPKVPGWKFWIEKRSLRAFHSSGSHSQTDLQFTASFYHRSCRSFCSVVLLACCKELSSTVAPSRPGLIPQDHGQHVRCSPTGASRPTSLTIRSLNFPFFASSPSDAAFQCSNHSFIIH